MYEQLLIDYIFSAAHIDVKAQISDTFMENMNF